MHTKTIRYPSGAIGIRESMQEIEVPEGCVELTGQELAAFQASQKEEDH